MTIRGKQLVTLLLFIILPTCIWAQSKRQQNNDKELLAKAIDYYQGSKYHEALLFFEQLNSRYVLNPRFKAYMAVCYYHDNDFKKTSETLDTLLHSLTVFAPREQAVYYFINAESHFQEQNYKQALTNFEQGLPLSDNKEKGYIYYRIGFCHLFNEEWQLALNAFEQSLKSYNDNNLPNIHEQQTLNMILGCQEKLKPTMEIAPDTLPQTPKSEGSKSPQTDTEKKKEE